MRRRLSLEGLRFGKFLIVAFSHMRNNRSVWHVQCDCGENMLIEGRRFMKAKKPATCPTCSTSQINTLSNLDRTKLRTTADLVRAMNEKSQPDHDTGCINWIGATYKGGYGKQQNLDRKVVSAHRLAYEIHVGPIPQGMGVLHRCDNPRCINPEHLFVGTQRENMRDKIDKGRYRNKSTGKLHENLITQS